MPPTTPAVLVVDDDEDLRQALVDMFTGEGYTVHEAADGHEALSVLRTIDEPLVVLLDYMLPRLNGDGVLAEVAQDPVLAARRAFILCTSQARTLPLTFARLLTDLGVRLLPKPFDLEDLLEAVGQAAKRITGAVQPEHPEP
jgi:CheY-like chemotaxis protein